jgi:triosephosphate isomerase
MEIKEFNIGGSGMRQPFIAGNWKMNKTVSEAKELVDELKGLVSGVEDVEIAVCPPAIDLVSVQAIVKESNIKLGAQNMHWKESGAYTGETSGHMLQEIETDYVILGHSERREYFNETDQAVNRKVKATFTYDLKPIICVGETLQEREDGETEDKVKRQVSTALAGLESEQVSDVVVAYEPIWAIGTGESASAEEANNVISYIREVIAEDYPDQAELIRIQYGGSVKPHNVAEFMEQEDIDGALVGGASLTADAFAGIIEGF